MQVSAIHIAPGSRLPVRAVDAVTAEAGKGLVGDRYHGTRRRHVTIQSQELLDKAAAELGRSFDAGATRRNITVDTGEIPTKPGTRLSIGDVELEVVRVSPPCRLLDDSIGPGAAAALRRRAGSACRVLSSGTIRVGDAVVIEPADTQTAVGA
jgi:MOSC domain-containing protein YiiM